MTTPFFIADTSPIFSYSLCVGCGSPFSWTSAYSPRGDGYDVTFHQTTNSSSVVSFTTSASTLAFRTGGTESQSGSCDASYSIDSGTLTEGCSLSLSGGRHSIQIQPVSGVETFTFYGVAGTTPLEQESLHNVTVDDTSASFEYTGAWTYMTSSGPSGRASNATVADQFSSKMTRLFNSTASISTSTDASATLSFKVVCVVVLMAGNAVYLYGVSGPEGGLARVAFDGTDVQTINMTNLWNSYSSLLFFETGLDATTEHEVKITNLSPGSQLVLDYALVTSEQSSKHSSPNLVMIIGTIAGVSAFLLVFGVLLYLYLVKRPPARPNQPSKPYAFSNGISYRDINLYSGKASSIDSWRKNAYPATTSTEESLGSGRLLSHPQPGSIPRLTPSPGQSPPPEYPDYIPYRGPIEREPPSSGAEESESRNATPSPPPSSQASSRQTPTSAVGLNRPAVIPLRPRREGDMEDIPLDGYSQQDLISPSSTMTSMLSATGMTTRAMGATRTVARLWPASVATSGIDLDTSATSPPSPHSSRGIPRRPARPERALSSDTLTYAAAYIYASPTSSSSTPSYKSPAISGETGRHSPSSTSANGNSTFNTLSTNPYPPSSYDYAPEGGIIRRGVSIKSVKTMRSFFSSLLNPNPSNSGHGRPETETPALPNAGHENARPDSGIFPSSVLGRSNSRLEESVPQRAPSFTARYGGAGALGLGYGSRTSRGSRGRRWPSAGASSTGAPPMLRLDSSNGVGQNFIIELDPNSPITAVGESRPGSVFGSSWRSHI